ncbi:AEC family transporter [Smaragdicoccus niigatensis]|uniref:AEC family transporter n=1 Tax=Smaragdicoccus niigatensis TaxID=359359 RepID=UPI000380C925|nr:AEC family transporter [Smaragdicoccus niigatensis]
MQQIALILLSLAIGVILRLSGRLPESATKVFGGWVINVALPATALSSVHGLSIDRDWWLAAAVPWICVAVACALIIPLSRALHWSRQRAGALILVAGWGNTAFVGLPMIAALAGQQWLGLGVVIDLFGSYLALSVVGIAIATVASAGHFDWRAVVRRIVTFPPFIAILVALATNHLARPEWVTEVFDTLAQTLTPIALAAVGYALRVNRISGRLGALSTGLTFRLLVAPAVIVLVYAMFDSVHDPVAKVAILEAAMPPSLGASIVAIDHDLEPDLVALLIGIGVPLALLTAWAWWSLLAY